MPIKNTVDNAIINKILIDAAANAIEKEGTVTTSTLTKLLSATCNRSIEFNDGFKARQYIDNHGKLAVEYTTKEGYSFVEHVKFHDLMTV